MSALTQPSFQLLKKGNVISRSESNGFGLSSASWSNPPSLLFTLEYIVIVLNAKRSTKKLRKVQFKLIIRILLDFSFKTYRCGLM